MEFVCRCGNNRFAFGRLLTESQSAGLTHSGQIRSHDSSHLSSFDSFFICLLFIWAGPSLSHSISSFLVHKNMQQKNLKLYLDVSICMTFLLLHVASNPLFSYQFPSSQERTLWLHWCANFFTLPPLLNGKFSWIFVSRRSWRMSISYLSSLLLLIESLLTVILSQICLLFLPGRFIFVFNVLWFCSAGFRNLFGFICCAQDLVSFITGEMLSFFLLTLLLLEYSISPTFCLLIPGTPTKCRCEIAPVVPYVWRQGCPPYLERRFLIFSFGLIYCVTLTLSFATLVTPFLCVCVCCLRHQGRL